MHDTMLHDQIAKSAALSQHKASTGPARRRRSDGTLTLDEIAICRSQGIALAYDPVQIGWVDADCQDDIDAADRPPLTPASGTRSLHQKPGFQPRNIAPVYRFRPWTVGDLPTYRRLLDDPAVWAMMYEAYPNPLDEDLARELIELSSASRRHEVMAVLRDGEIVGQVRILFDHRTDPHSAEISYWLGQAHWGRGIGSAVVAIYSGHSFLRHPALTSLVAVVHQDNAASRKVLRKAGYTEEGSATKRDGWITYRMTRDGAGLINSGSDRP